jgi:predicted GIY-YIG superfamily endonuclease
MSNWHVYLLYHRGSNRTYIGATTDPARRLRQHNREITGGARSTGKVSGGWELICYLSGFPNRSVCYRWEKLLKLRAWTLPARSLAFKLVAHGICPSSRNKIQYPVPGGLTLVQQTTEGPIQAESDPLFQLSSYVRTAQEVLLGSVPASRSKKRGRRARAPRSRKPRAVRSRK